MNKQVKIKFEFDSVDTKNQNFRGWNIDNVRVHGPKIRCATPDTAWAGGNGSNSYLKTDGNGIAITGRTINGTTAPVNRYTYDAATGKIIDLFGKGYNANPAYGHTGGSTQKSNADNNPGNPNNATMGDNQKLYDYVPDYTNANTTGKDVFTYTIRPNAGLVINAGISSTNGIQSIDAFKTEARYYTDGTRVFDRFGNAKQNPNADTTTDSTSLTAATGTNTDNKYMTTNANNTLGETTANDDKGLIDYDPGAALDVENLLNVIELGITRLVQYDPAPPSTESRIKVDGTGINEGIPAISTESITTTQINQKFDLIAPGGLPTNWTQSVITGDSGSALVNWQVATKPPTGENVAVSVPNSLYLGNPAGSLITIMPGEN